MNFTGVRFSGRRLFFPKRRQRRKSLGAAWRGGADGGCAQRKGAYARIWNEREGALVLDWRRSSRKTHCIGQDGWCKVSTSQRAGSFEHCMSCDSFYFSRGVVAAVHNSSPQACQWECSSAHSISICVLSNVVPLKLSWVISENPMENHTMRQYWMT